MATLGLDIDIAPYRERPVKIKGIEYKIGRFDYVYVKGQFGWRRVHLIDADPVKTVVNALRKLDKTLPVDDVATVKPGKSPNTEQRVLIALRNASCLKVCPDLQRDTGRSDTRVEIALLALNKKGAVVRGPKWRIGRRVVGTWFVPTLKRFKLADRVLWLLQGCGKAMTAKDIAEVLGSADHSVRNVIPRLREAGLLVQGDGVEIAHATNLVCTWQAVDRIVAVSAFVVEGDAQKVAA